MAAKSLVSFLFILVKNYMFSLKTSQIVNKAFRNNYPLDSAFEEGHPKNFLLIDIDEHK